MVSCNESSQSDAGGGATPRAPTRAGLRRPPRNDEPTGVFVVIEMAVLSCVSVLAMVSIIVSIDDGVAGARPSHVSRVDDPTPAVALAHGAAIAASRADGRDATGDRMTVAGDDR